MTKSQCYNEIARNNQLISQYQGQIDTLSKEIGELETTESKVTNMKATLSTCKQTGVSRLSNTSKVNKINTKIIGKIFNNINGLFTGNEYENVFSGLGKAIERVQDEIQKRRREIENLKGNIASCNTTINNMNNTISRIEAEEREAARREEERRAAEREAARREEERRAAEEQAVAQKTSISKKTKKKK